MDGVQRVGRRTPVAPGVTVVRVPDSIIGLGFGPDAGSGLYEGAVVAILLDAGESQ